jgi:hypothetical protein
VRLHLSSSDALIILEPPEAQFTCGLTGKIYNLAKDVLHITTFMSN